MPMKKEYIEIEISKKKFEIEKLERQLSSARSNRALFNMDCERFEKHLERENELLKFLKSQLKKVKE